MEEKDVSLPKQGLVHWVVDIITMASIWTGHPALTVTCHFMRSASYSWALFSGVLLQEVCAAATWASLCTFSSFYKSKITPPSKVNVPVISGHLSN